MTNDQGVASTERLSFTLFLAVAVHAILIFGIGFSSSSDTKVAPTLNITLATHQSKVAPEKANFLAQHDQQASGTAEEIKELTVKKQAKFNDINVRDVSPVAQQKRQTDSQASSQVVVTTQSRADLKAQKNKNDNEQQNHEAHSGAEVEIILNQPEFMSLRAKLDNQIQELASRPRIRRLTSVATRASSDARYLNSWAQRVESIGNAHFPKAALENEIYGNLRLAVLLASNGTVEHIEITQSSGFSILDTAAIQIVKLASPFKPLPKEVLKDADKLEIIRTWRFEITGLTTD
ncbi:MAG: energy transducer TonB [Alteromonadaceae bacterium]|nr:MAG: energy transducer TonB [Alteromonadaceae bacterium]